MLYIRRNQFEFFLQRKEHLNVKILSFLNVERKKISNATNTFLDKLFSIELN